MARISGLASGLDTDALIQELVSAYETKQQTYVKKQTKLGWTQEAWKSLNSKVYSFYTGKLNTARFSTAYSAKKATVSDDTKATVTAASNAVIGTQSLRVKQLAKTAYLTGGELQGKTTDGVQTKLTANSKLSDIAGWNVSGDAKIDVSSGNGATTKTITVNGETSISSFVNQLKDAGVNASFDAENGRFFISGKESGTQGEFSLTAANADGIDALGALGLSVTTAEDYQNYAEIASDSSYVQRNADTQYVKSVLTEANAALQKDKAYLDSVLAYLEDTDAYETKHTEQKDAAKNSINELQEKIKTQFADDTQNPLLVDMFESKQVTVDGESVDRYVLKDAYLTDGEPDEEKINNAVKVALGYVTDDGTAKLDEDLTDEEKTKFNKAKSFVTEINQYIEKTEAYDANIQNLNDTLAKYQETASNAGYNVADETTLETAKTKLQAQVTTLQEQMDANTAAMSKTYNREDTESVTYYAKNDAGDVEEITITFADLKADDTNTTYQNLVNTYQSTFNAKTKALAEGNDNIGYREVDGVGELYDTKTDGKLTISADGYLKATDGTYVTGSTDGGLSYGSEADAKTIAQLSSTVDANGNVVSGSAVRVSGADAVIELNGATFTSDTNNFSINGLTITATAETGDEAISISTTSDIDGMYNTIKDLINGYNDILKEMNTLYYADSSKGYEPLTDDEKEAMTDTEIEKWEEKIKTSLLRRDDTLSSLMTGLRNVTAKSYTINDKNYSLSTFGISTSGYFSIENEERGLLHIDGNSEDEKTSGNVDKLRAALATDPDTVIEFFQTLANELYTNITNKMSRTSLSSSYTLYNDKQLQNQYDEYDDIIDEWDEKIENYTEKYVKQFTAMEKAMTQLQSSTSQLTSMLG